MKSCIQQIEVTKDEPKLNEVMITLKVADFDNKQLLYKNTLFINRGDTLDFHEIANAYGIIFQDLQNQNYHIFLEPSSNLSIKKNIIKYS